MQTISKGKATAHKVVTHRLEASEYMATLGVARKTVSFNLDNPEERTMYEFIHRQNFSKMVKRYITAELQRIKAQQTTTTVSMTNRNNGQ